MVVLLQQDSILVLLLIWIMVKFTGALMELSKTLAILREELAKHTLVCQEHLPLLLRLTMVQEQVD